MRYATFNVLADAYTGYGDYSHVNPDLMQSGARLSYLSRQINDLSADVVGLQEADRSLVEVFENDENWQSFWTPKGRNKPDGCLTLVKREVEVLDHESYSYDDESGHVFQVTHVGEIAVANTHIKWAPEDDPLHIGVSQTHELLTTLSSQEAAVILADCNGRPGGRVQTMVEQAGFTNVSAERPTAIVNGELVALDLLAIRGLRGTLIPTDYDLHFIPNESCASDHIPVVAEIID
jgi:endonuclease/exonuclease/phosphatase family metal-dependent hydrolase